MPDESQTLPEAWRAIAGGRAILIVADHASANVPADIDLGISRDVLSRHVAVDIGVAPLTEALCDRLRCSAILCGVSRLVCDCNRDEQADALVPVESDTIPIPGNHIDAAGRAARIERFFKPYHAAVAAQIALQRPDLIISLHSFTPCLTARPFEARPWEIGILYNTDDRAARLAISRLQQSGIVTGDNQPYSGRHLNATMNRHAEAHAIPYLGIEVRQDLISQADGVSTWAQRLAPIVSRVRDDLVGKAHDSVQRIA